MQWVRRAVPRRIWVALRPSPISISTSSPATSRPSNSSSQWPPCSSGPMMGTVLRIRHPGWSAWKRNAERPRRVSSDVRAMTMKCFASPAPVMNHLRPEITHFPPRRSARVCIAPAGSDPAPGAGSVMTNEERTSPSMMGWSQRSFWYSVPTRFSRIMLPSSGAWQLKVTGPKMERFISS